MRCKELLLGFNLTQLEQLDAQQIHAKPSLVSQQLKLEHVLKIDSRTRRFHGLHHLHTQQRLLRAKRSVRLGTRGAINKVYTCQYWVTQGVTAPVPWASQNVEELLWTTRRPSELTKEQCCVIRAMRR